MAKIDYKRLNLNIGKFKIIKNAAIEIAESKLSSSRDVFLRDFSSHPVTVEIEAGQNSGNISGTLGGYGNLFSFIGFSYNSNPTGIIKKLISKIRLIRKSYIKPDTDGVLIKFNIYAPRKSEFEDATPIPWSTGRSWLTGIEKGISGLGYFISRIGSGRSEGGVQADKKIRQPSFKNVSYFSKMYSDFFKKIVSSK